MRTLASSNLLYPAYIADLNVGMLKTFAAHSPHEVNHYCCAFWRWRQHGTKHTKSRAYYSVCSVQCPSCFCFFFFVSYFVDFYANLKPSTEQVYTHPLLWPAALLCLNRHYAVGTRAIQRAAVGPTRTSTGQQSLSRQPSCVFPMWEQLLGEVNNCAAFFRRPRHTTAPPHPVYQLFVFSRQ